MRSGERAGSSTSIRSTPCRAGNPATPVRFSSPLWLRADKPGLPKPAAASRRTASTLRAHAQDGLAEGRSGIHKAHPFAGDFAAGGMTERNDRGNQPARGEFIVELTGILSTCHKGGH